jgi:hypothetical protein
VFLGNRVIRECGLCSIPATSKVTLGALGVESNAIERRVIRPLASIPRECPP